MTAAAPLLLPQGQQHVLALLKFHQTFDWKFDQLLLLLVMLLLLLPVLQAIFFCDDAQDGERCCCLCCCYAWLPGHCRMLF
jgi:hypothetical protein